MSNRLREKTKIRLSDHFTGMRLLRFVMPSVIMMVFTSVYGVVDGLFVSNYAGKTAFAALNLVFPFLMILGGLGFMIGTGGSAIVAITLGAGKRDKANEYFSMLIYVTVGLGVAMTVIGLMILRPVCVFLKAEGEMLKGCMVYGRILLVCQTAFMLQNVFQSFLITAEKPKLGLKVTVAAGLTNVGLDWLMIGVLRWGLAGAALATGLSQIVGGVIPVIYFSRKNDSLLKLTKARFEGHILFKTITNGSSELMTNISMSLVNILYNFQLMSVAGENGVAAYGVIMYMNFIFSAIYLGYSIGSAPVISYHYGAGNREELGSLFRKSLVIMAVSGLMMTLTALGAAGPLTEIFVGYDRALYAMTVEGFCLYALAFLVNGINIFGSSFFTALGNGAVSAGISFLRTLVFQVFSVMILPVYMGIKGIWLAIVVAEVLALMVTLGCMVKYKNRYGYGRLRST